MPRESLVSLLRAGHLVGLSPGGTYEAQMGDNMYKVAGRREQGKEQEQEKEQENVDMSKEKVR